MKLRSLVSLGVFIGLLVALLGLGRAPVAHAASSHATATLNGTYVTVNNGPGDQTDPHVSGDWVSYTNNSPGINVIRYHNLVTGADAQIPNNGNQDALSGISGTTVVYADATASSQDVYRYDIGSGNGPVDLITQPNEELFGPAIGNRTVAWMDIIDPNHPQIVAYNLDTQVATSLHQPPMRP